MYSYCWIYNCLICVEFSSLFCSNTLFFVMCVREISFLYLTQTLCFSWCMSANEGIYNSWFRSYFSGWVSLRYWWRRAMQTARRTYYISPISFPTGLKVIILWSVHAWIGSSFSTMLYRCIYPLGHVPIPSVTMASYLRYVSCHRLITLRPRQNGRRFADDTFKRIFLMKIVEFRLRFQWSLFLRVQLTIIQHWFR